MEKGWKNFREINRVTYDPKKVKLEKMVEWLKESGTYQEIIHDSSIKELKNE